MERRLAAILAADVVGYSRLMGQDEAGTLQALKVVRAEFIDPKIAEHKGRIFKATGDGVLAEFTSVVNAVACAVDIQRAMASRDVDLPEDKTIQLRIGVNLGDVIVEGEDVFGDGVNVASRLEGIASPGGVAVSGVVRDQIGNRLDLQFEDMGAQALKNIELPVQVYGLSAGGGVATTNPTHARAEKPSIAVLPFTNMSGDAEQQYFSDGITEDIITELSRFRQFKVMARNSSFRFRGTDLDMMRVGRELGVHYLVEGSVRRMGGRIRITAQLIDAKSGHHLWADRFDRNQEEIFGMQDEVVRTVVATLSGRLQAVGAETARRKPPTSLAAYECVLRGDALPRHDQAAREEATRLYERAITLDPGFARAHALLAMNVNFEWDQSLIASTTMLDRAFSLAKKSVELDDNDDLCQDVLGSIHLDLGSFDLAEYHYRRALELNRNRPTLFALLGRLYAYLGRPREALVYFEEARTLDPLFQPPWYWTCLGFAHFVARQYGDAIKATSRSSRTSYWRTHALLAACHAHMNEDDLARDCARETLRLAPDFTIARYVTREPFKEPADREHMIAGLRNAGLPE